MTTTSDAAALLAAMVEHPGEDTPRLMLADELEDTDPARAEFIRVQCEWWQLTSTDRACPYVIEHITHDSQPFPVARWMLGGCQCRGCAIARCESHFIATRQDQWRKGPACRACHGKGICTVPVSNRYDNKTTGYERLECRTCYGTGDAGGLLRRFGYDLRTGTRTRAEYPVVVHFRRGFIERVEVPTLDALVQEGNPQGSLATSEDAVSPTPWLRAVLDATHTPERALIREVVPLCREPDTIDDEFCWVRERDDIDDLDATVPDFLFALLEGAREESAGPDWADQFGTEDTWKVYPTREDAVAALGRAVATWARREMA